MSQASKLPRWKFALFSLIPLLLLSLLAEVGAFAYFYFTGQIQGNLEFHPLFKSRGLQSVTFDSSHYQYDPFLGYRYKPNSAYGALRINEHGFIVNGGDFPDLARKPAGVYRVFILGGSTVAGTGSSSNATTIASSLEEQLRSSGSGTYEIINAGVDGYTSFQELLYLLSNISRYSPDLVIIYDGWNDFIYPTQIGGYADEYQKECCWPNAHEYALYLLTAYERLNRRSISFINPGVMLDRTYATILLQKAVNRLIPGRNVEIASTLNVRHMQGKVVIAPQEAAKRYLANIEHAAHWSSGGGTPLIYALQPAVNNKQARTPSEEKLLLSARVDRPASSSYEAFQKEVRAGLAARRIVGGGAVRLVDLSESMWKNVAETVYVDECHTNDAGNKIIARAFAREIAALRRSSKS